MLSHLYRFHGHGGLRYLYRNGKTARSRSFLLRYMTVPSRKHSRVTVSVSKKIMKSAARRNRIRRRIYEVVRTNWEQLSHPYDVSITVYSPDVLRMPASELQRELSHLFSQARLYKMDAPHDKMEETET